jgi:hypothetical protein
MGINGVVRVTSKKTFYITLKDGQQVELEQDEAEIIRDYLVEQLPKVSGISTESYLQGDPRNTTTSFHAPSFVTPVETSITTTRKRRPIPMGYMFFAEKTSEPKNGRAPLTYRYYKDTEGNYGFVMVSEIHGSSSSHSFSRLGKITDSSSTIGKFIRKIPSDSFISRADIQKKGILRNAQMLKAILDMLEIEKWLERKPAYDGRRGSEYRRVKSLSEPEGFGNDNAKDLIISHVSSGSVKAGVSP